MNGLTQIRLGGRRRRPESRFGFGISVVFTAAYHRRTSCSAAAASAASSVVAASAADIDGDNDGGDGGDRRERRGDPAPRKGSGRPLAVAPVPAEAMELREQLLQDRDACSKL